MRKFKSLLFFAAVLVFVSGCGVHNALVTNTNNNVTNVELSSDNYRVIQKVSGEATATYVLGIGGLSKKTLVENAKSKMFQEADMEGKARAIVNIVTETYYKTFLGFYTERTVTVSGYVVEFE